jgi:hypothetical protein
LAAFSALILSASLCANCSCSNANVLDNPCSALCLCVSTASAWSSTKELANSACLLNVSTMAAPTLLAVSDISSNSFFCLSALSSALLSLSSSIFFCSSVTFLAFFIASSPAFFAASFSVPLVFSTTSISSIANFFLIPIFLCSDAFSCSSDSSCCLASASNNSLPAFSLKSNTSLLFSP